MVPGFTALDKEDQAQLKTIFKPKKVKKEVKVKAEVKAEPVEESKLEKALKRQNKLLWSIKDKLKEWLVISSHYCWLAI